MTTIRDVARIAGVGIGTVSRVLNNSPEVKPVTREKVLAAVAALNFKPHPLARSMISKRTGAIGVLVPFFTRPFFIEVVRGVERILSSLEREIVLYNVANNSQRDAYFAHLPMLHKVDGLLIVSIPLGDSVAQRLNEAGLPVVLVDAYHPLLTSLVVENVEGAYSAVKRLIERGHRRIGFINGIKEGNFKFNQANDRLIGLHRALGEAGMLFEPELVVTTEWDQHKGKEAALRLLAQEPRPTALFAASDLLAIGALEAARDLHLSVPDDLSIIGFDDIEIAKMLELSTVHQPMQQMGEQGIHKLLEHINNPQKEPELIRFHTTLIERRTTTDIRSTYETLA